jgi:hypothetical protein
VSAVPTRWRAVRGGAVVVLALVATLAAVATAAGDAVAAPDAATALRDANAAATAGDWAAVDALVAPLLVTKLTPADLAEAHRLRGLAAFFDERAAQAEVEFLAYLRLDLDGRLDPAIYPPEAITFFEGIRTRHAAELRARRPQPRRYVVLNLLPPAGQFQNGERTKGFVIGGLLGGLAIANVTTYLVLRSWCGGAGSTCDRSGTDHAAAANQLRAFNYIAGIGLIATYAWGIYDGIRGYRRRTAELELAPTFTPTTGGGMIGVGARF